MRSFETSKLVKTEDLNHHNTLFAGKLAEWFTEAAFIGASHLYGKYGETDHLVSVEVHSLKFLAPSFNGDILKFKTMGIKGGTTSLTVYVEALINNTDIKACEGFITFVAIDENKQKIPHNIVLKEAQTTKEKEILERFNNLRN